MTMKAASIAKALSKKAIPAYLGYETLGAFNTLYRNKKELNSVKLSGADNYYHTRAAYENSQKGLVRGLIGQALGVGNEVKDIIYKGFADDKHNLAEILADSAKDLKNNWRGFIMGYNNPDVPVEEQEGLKILMPPGLAEKLAALKKGKEND